MSNTAALLLVPHLQVQNTNAISGPFTWGFPSPTAFTGFVHALERRLSKEFDLEFGGIGIVCHHFEPQISQPANRRHQVFCLTRNPLNRSGATAALVEEARAHMEISLVIEVLTELDSDDQTELTECLLTTIHAMRLAGGSILPRYGKRHQPEWFDWWDDDADNITAFRKLRNRLLPGFALIQREDLLAEHLQEMRVQNAGSNALDALIDLSRLNMEPSGPDPKKPSETLWKARSKPGWLVPVPVGYAALSPLYLPGEVSNARDEQTHFRFVESLYSLGQWISPHRLTELKQLLWRHEADIETGIYRCANQYANTLNNA
ncbi:MAG: type I-F CRISPR-associated protein Csy2 [gamma proteobacterium endosymbiont of Lamellibrachia anaximandri]|nr:type I-F CRISPR-associated protein Csy2 [gamma proteobacterium endosymbiont of Lamellibrachia anaximandri]MBL3619209.1 type I-F CRISPR-associated protein Csy2 [gamma proteobacterium endosymbiont of Lamellibrachia anaximandri]